MGFGWVDDGCDGNEIVRFGQSPVFLIMFGALTAVAGIAMFFHNKAQSNQSLKGSGQ
jgi:hypothetical protein